MRHLVLIAVALLMVVGTGCRPRDIREARSIVASAAQSLNLADLQLAEDYKHAHDVCLHGSQSRLQYDKCIDDWDYAANLLSLTRLQLFQVQYAIDVWDATGNSSLFKEEACFYLEKAAELQTLLDTLKSEARISAPEFQC